MSRHISTIRLLVLLLVVVGICTACGQNDAAATVGAPPPVLRPAVPSPQLLPSVTPTSAPTVVTGSTPTTVLTATTVITFTELPTSTPVRPAATIPLTIAGHVLQVELASTQQQRAQGLMFRTEMPADHGMLFVYPSARTMSFWMRNTFLALSIAFIDTDGSILNIEDMEPLNEVPRYRSAGPAQYALEVNQGWFAERGIEAGEKVEFVLPVGLPIDN